MRAGVNRFGIDVDGDWYAIVYETKYTAPTPHDPDWPCTLVEDTFHVEPSAIPEFPTTLAAIIALALPAGAYFWMRRRASRVAVPE